MVREKQICEYFTSEEWICTCETNFAFETLKRILLDKDIPSLFFSIKLPCLDFLGNLFPSYSIFN